MKSSLLLTSLFLFAASASAQTQHSRMPAMEAGSTLNSGYGQGGWGSGFGASSFGSHGRAVRYESPRDFGVISAKNDGAYVPSVYMKYDDAVALGQQVLAAEERAARGESMPSLGEVARAFRAIKVPTLKLESRVLQDETGKLVVCNLNGNDCRRP